MVRKTRAASRTKVPGTAAPKPDRRAAAKPTSGAAPRADAHAVLSPADATKRLVAEPTGTRGPGAAERLIVETAIRSVGIERAIALLRSAQSRIDRLLAD